MKHLLNIVWTLVIMVACAELHAGEVSSVNLQWQPQDVLEDVVEELDLVMLAEGIGGLATVGQPPELTLVSVDTVVERPNLFDKPSAVQFGSRNFATRSLGSLKDESAGDEQVEDAAVVKPTLEALIEPDNSSMSHYFDVKSFIQTHASALRQMAELDNDLYQRFMQHAEYVYTIDENHKKDVDSIGRDAFKAFLDEVEVLGSSAMDRAPAVRKTHEQ